MQEFELISIGVLALLVVLFVVDMVRARSGKPAPQPVPQRRQEVAVKDHPETAVQPAADKPLTTPVVPTEKVGPSPSKENLFARMKQGLGKTRTGLSDTLTTLFLGKKTIDDDLLEEIDQNNLFNPQE